MDRGFVLNLIRTYYKLMTAKAASLPEAHAHALISYKIGKIFSYLKKKTHSFFY